MTDRKPGRPPILTQCLRCAVPKPRRDYVGTSSGVCKGCRQEIRGVKALAPTQTEDRSNTDHLDARLVKPEIRDAVLEAISLKAVTAQVTKFAFDLKLPPRCECCWETRHVTRDGYGGVAIVCARCEYQIRATGCCHLHHGFYFGRVLYPELFKPEAVPTPGEIEALFYVPESTKSKFDAVELATEADVG